VAARISRAAISVGIAALAVATPYAPASVVMTGTRVIYDADAPSRSVQLTNEDDKPNVIQAWVDSGDPDSTPQTADAPFIVTPPLFRMEPRTGQEVRVVYTGPRPAQDREAVFYLNTVQIPPMDAAYAGQNQVLVLVRNRVKLFYRPSTIPGRPERAHEQLRFRATRQQGDLLVTASNGSGYHISMIDAHLSADGENFAFLPDMVAPYADRSWRVAGAGRLAGRLMRVRYRFLNDSGGVVQAEAPLDASVDASAGSSIKP